MPDAPFFGNLDDPVRRFPLCGPLHRQDRDAPHADMRQLVREEISRELYYLAGELRSLRADRRRD